MTKRAKSKLNVREVEVKQSTIRLQLKNIITRNLSKYQVLVQKKKKFRRKKSLILRRKSKSMLATLPKYFVSKYPSIKIISILRAQFFVKSSELNTN